MSDNDSSSEDDEYKPSNAEINEADADAKRQKRRKIVDSETALRQAKAGRTSAKVEDLWQQLKGPSSAQRLVSSAVSLTKGASKASIPAADQEWMKQLGITSYTPSQSSSRVYSKAKLQGPAVTSTAKVVTSESAKKTLSDPEAANRALAAAKAAISGTSVDPNGNISVLETRRFAGKNIQVTKQATQEEAEKLKEKEKEKKSGIDAVLASLEAAKKVNVLDKSRDDWGNFKKTDIQIEAELDAYKKSGGKYLDKVDFLKRAELREYEAERDQRLAGDIRNRSRA